MLLTFVRQTTIAVYAYAFVSLYFQVKFKLKINKNKAGTKAVADGRDVDDDVKKQVSKHSLLSIAIRIISIFVSFLFFLCSHNLPKLMTYVTTHDVLTFPFAEQTIEEPENSCVGANAAATHSSR